MFKEFPTLIAPIASIATVQNTLSGTILTSTDSKQVTGNGNFVIEVAVGSQLFTADMESIGYVGQILDEHTLLLEENAKYAVSNETAIVKNYKSGYKLASNGFLYPEKANAKYIADFFRRVVVNEKYSKTAAVYVPYTVEEGETPEMVSYKFYGTPFYHWIILMMNNITNPREEWPLDSNQLERKISVMYPDNNPYDIYEYRNTETRYVEDYDAEKLIQGIIYPVTIYDYESEMNEHKRIIKVLQPAFLDEFVRSYYNALNSSV